MALPTTSWSDETPATTTYTDEFGLISIVEPGILEPDIVEQGGLETKWTEETEPTTSWSDE